MIRTLIFGAIAGYVGKKLYDEGKLTGFKDDLVARYKDASANLAAREAQSAPIVTSTAPRTTAPPATPPIS